MGSLAAVCGAEVVVSGSVGAVLGAVSGAVGAVLGAVSGAGIFVESVSGAVSGMFVGNRFGS